MTAFNSEQESHQLEGFKISFSKYMNASILTLAFLSGPSVLAQDETTIFQDGIVTYTSGFYDVWSRDWKMTDKRGEVSDFIRDGVSVYNTGRYSEAVNLWEKAAQKDDIEALIVLGKMYADGINVTRSIATAKDYHLRASKLLRDAKGRTKEAIEYILPYADMKHEDAKLELVRVYLALHDTDNRAKAHTLLSPEFLAQNAEANYLKGLLEFRQTKGSIKKKLLTRIEWQRKSGEMGYAPGQVIYGQAHENGRGVEKSYEKAAIWYKKAMAQNHASGFYNLGMLYNSGNGVERNDKESARLIEKAAALGNFIAQIDTGDNYRRGNGVQKNLETAIEWYEKAQKAAFARNDYKQSTKLGVQIEEIKVKLKTQSIAE